MAKLSKEKIEQTAREAGYELVNMDNYINLDSPIEVRCNEKHLNLFNVKELRRKKECPICKEQGQLQTSEKNIIDLPPKLDIRLLSIDGATKISGFAVFEGGRLIHQGVKTMSNNDNIIARIAEMRHWLIAVLKKWEIDEVAIEDIYAETGYGTAGPQTMIKLAKLLGVLEVASYEVLQGKVNVVPVSTWRGFCKVKTKPRNAAKESAQLFVKNKFGIFVSFDCADAICLGYYAWNNRTRLKQEFINF